MYVSALVAIAGIYLAWARYGEAPRAEPDEATLGKLWRLFTRLFGRTGSHRRTRGHLTLAILPLEDTHVLETDRLERCPTAQAYYDPKQEKTRFIPLCAWKLHNKRILREIADHYSQANPKSQAPNPKQAANLKH